MRAPGSASPRGEARPAGPRRAARWCDSNGSGAWGSPLCSRDAGLDGVVERFLHDLHTAQRPGHELHGELSRFRRVRAVVHEPCDANEVGLGRLERERHAQGELVRDARHSGRLGRGERRQERGHVGHDQHPPVHRGDAADERRVDRRVELRRGADLVPGEGQHVDHRVHRDADVGAVEVQVDHDAHVRRGLRDPGDRLGGADLAHVEDVDRVLLVAEAEREVLGALGGVGGAHQNSVHSSVVAPEASAARLGRCGSAAALAGAWSTGFAGALGWAPATLKTDTACDISRASCFSASLAAVDSSTSAAFCWVTLSSCDTAELACTMPLACSAVAVAISLISCETRLTLATISPMVEPAPPASLAPASTRCTESVMRPLISRAASAERWARLRTSPATTAKPRPCSPARAASTAALSARMLVWKAIESITPMMSAMRRELSWMPSMVFTTWSTASPPRWATFAAPAASSLAVAALCAFWLTVAVISSMEAAVSSRFEACSSVREDRSLLPAAIWPEATVTFSAASRTPFTMSAREVFISASERSTSPSSSSRPTSMRLLRSPEA